MWNEIKALKIETPGHWPSRARLHHTHTGWAPGPVYCTAWPDSSRSMYATVFIVNDTNAHCNKFLRGQTGKRQNYLRSCRELSENSLIQFFTLFLDECEILSSKPGGNGEAATRPTRQCYITAYSAAKLKEGKLLAENKKRYVFRLKPGAP